MRQPVSSVLSETGQQEWRDLRRGRPPVVERIAGWSVAHRRTAVGGWLVLVAAAFVGGQMLSASNVPSYDAGQSGQAERTLERLNVISPPTESVLIQARSPAATVASDPAMRQAIRQVTAGLDRLPQAAAHIRSPLPPGHGSLVSADGRSALVMFTVPGNRSNEDQAVVPALRAVAAVQASHPHLLVAQAGIRTHRHDSAGRTIPQSGRCGRSGCGSAAPSRDAAGDLPQADLLSFAEPSQRAEVAAGKARLGGLEHAAA